MAAVADGIKWEDPSCMAQPEDYILSDGRRYVRPYFFEFVAHVKRRWEGQEIAQLFAKEFRQRPLEYYMAAIEAGRIKLEGRLVKADQILRDSQTMSHFVHRHEPPVQAAEVEVLLETPDVLTVCKPASVPVHPCGQYRKNTVIGLLQAQRDFGQLFPVHRLDRLVSGLLILARNSASADRFRQQIEGGLVRKEYVARVVGTFPEGEVSTDAPLVYDSAEGRSYVQMSPNPTVLRQIDPSQKPGAKGKKKTKKGVGAYHGDGPGPAKAACTKFRRLACDGRTSIVLCMPQTGRTHQIRVHLQHLGHPIANDFLYLAPVGSLPGAVRSKTGTTAGVAARRASMAVPATQPPQAGGSLSAAEAEGEPLVSHREAVCMEELGSRSAQGLERAGGAGGRLELAGEVMAQPARKLPRIGNDSPGSLGVDSLATSLAPLGDEVACQNRPVVGEDLPGGAGTAENVPGTTGRASLAPAEADDGCRPVPAVGEVPSGQHAGGPVHPSDSELPKLALTREISRSSQGIPNVTGVTGGGELGARHEGAVPSSQTAAMGGHIERSVPASANRSTGITSPANIAFELDPLCPVCPHVYPPGYEEDIDGLWLHCVRYSGEGWCYECPLPSWGNSLSSS